MKPTGFALIASTLVISALMAGSVFYVTGSILLAFATYSLGGGAVMLVLAFGLYFLHGMKLARSEEEFSRWDQDLKEERRETASRKEAVQRKKTG